MAINDNYVMDLESSEDANKSSVRGLTDDEKEQMQRLRKQIRLELGLEDPEIDTTYVRTKQPEVAAQQPTTDVSEQAQAAAEAEQIQEPAQQEVIIAQEQPEQYAEVNANVSIQEQETDRLTAGQKIEQMYAAKHKKDGMQQQEVVIQVEDQQPASEATIQEAQQPHVEAEAESQVIEPVAKQEATEPKVIAEPEIAVETKASTSQSKVSTISEEELKAALNKDPASVPREPEPEESISDEEFFEKYKKKSETIDISTYGKYDSDLDFKLNRKIKKIRLPMPKGVKAMVASLVMVILAASVVGIALWLYKPPEKVELTRASVATQKVTGVYVGDRLSYDNLYIDCAYSDGSTNRVPITSNLVTSVAGSVQNGVFTRRGEVWITLNYKGRSIMFYFDVSERILQDISIISIAEVNDNAPIEVSAGQVDLSDKIILLANYDDNSSWIVDINKCQYSVNNGDFKSVVDGKIDLSLSGDVRVGYNNIKFIYNGVQSKNIRLNVLG